MSELTLPDLYAMEAAGKIPPEVAALAHDGLRFQGIRGMYQMLRDLNPALSPTQAARGAVKLDGLAERRALDEMGIGDAARRVRSPARTH